MPIWLMSNTWPGLAGAHTNARTPAYPHTHTHIHTPAHTYAHRGQIVPGGPRVWRRACQGVHQWRQAVVGNALPLAWHEIDGAAVLHDAVRRGNKVVGRSVVVGLHLNRGVGEGPDERNLDGPASFRQGQGVLFILHQHHALAGCVEHQRAVLGGVHLLQAVAAVGLHRIGVKHPEPHLDAKQVLERRHPCCPRDVPRGDGHTQRAVEVPRRPGSNAGAVCVRFEVAAAVVVHPGAEGEQRRLVGVAVRVVVPAVPSRRVPARGQEQ